jgi:hypothetical protein
MLEDMDIRDPPRYWQGRGASGLLGWSLVGSFRGQQTVRKTIADLARGTGEPYRRRLEDVWGVLENRAWVPVSVCAGAFQAPLTASRAQMYSLTQ